MLATMTLPLTSTRAVAGARPALTRALRPQARRLAVRKTSVVVRAESTPDITLEESSTGYAGIIAVAGYAAAHFNKLHVDSGLLLKALGIYTAATALITLVTGSNYANQMGSVVGPAALAAYALAIKHVTFLDTVTAFSGYYLAEQLEPKSFFWGFVASLAVALYYNKGTLWYAAASGLVAATKLFRAYDRKETIPVFNVAILGVTIWAIYQEKAALWAILLYLGHTAWGAVTTSKGLVDRFAD